MGQLAAGREAVHGRAREFELGHIHVAADQPEHIIQQRQRAGDAAGGFERAAEIAALVRVADARSSRSSAEAAAK